jgi:hypothetical protein
MIFASDDSSRIDNELIAFGVYVFNRVMYILIRDALTLNGTEIIEVYYSGDMMPQNRAGGR